MREALEELVRLATVGPPEELPARVAAINQEVALGVAFSALYMRVVYAGRDEWGRGWVCVQRPEDPFHAGTSVWPEWAYPVAEGAVRSSKQLIVWFLDSGTGPDGSNITMAVCTMYKSN
jgi:hypothetical protein